MAKKCRSKPGRPAKMVDPKKVIELASQGCAAHEIAALEDCSESTITHKFAEQLKRGRSIMHASLRKKQTEKALGGSDTMLIWLGKNELGQVDKQALTVGGSITVVSEIPRPVRNEQ